MNTSVFRAYDIRGLAPQEITEDLAFRVGQAFVRFIGAKLAATSPERTAPLTVAVGRDMRETTPMLFAAFVRGITSQGADVVDVGMLTTPMMYFAAANYPQHDAGAMITASHNPAQYNGIKLCEGDAFPIGAESGMHDVRDLAAAGPYPDAPRLGTVRQLDIRPDYYDRIFRGIDASALRPLKVVVDTGNGMEGDIIRDIFARLPNCAFDGLFLELDGRFPNHEANPLKEETLDALKQRVRETGADLGIAFDGDGDRIGMVDERGENIRGDLLLALVARVLLARNPGATVLYDVRCSMVVPEEIAAAGGTPEMCRVGHGFIKPHMRRTNALFAGELSNHFYFREMFGADSTDTMMLAVLTLMSDSGKKLSELVAPLRRYFHSGEINFEVGDKDAALARIRAAFAPQAASVNEIDGLRMDFGDWWFSVRASNTEPLLRLNLEAKSGEVLVIKKQELASMISS